MKQLTVHAIVVIPIVLTVPDDYEITSDTPEDIEPIMGDDGEPYELCDQVDIALSETTLLYDEVFLISSKYDVTMYLSECLGDDIEPYFA